MQTMPKQNKVQTAHMTMHTTKIVFCHDMVLNGITANDS